MKLRFLLFLLVLGFSSCNNKQESIFPSKSTLVESVYASAIVQPDSLYNVYASVSGILDKQFIREGENVKRGTPLFQIFNKAPELTKENARINYTQAKNEFNGSAAILDEMKREIETAQLKFENDSINYKRQARLWKQEIGSKAEFDISKLNYESSSNNLRALEGRYNRTKNDLKNKVTQAGNSYEAARVNSNDFTVKSKIDGRVYSVYKNIGELITAQEPLAAIGSASKFNIELLVDEVDIVKLNIGQKVIINLDAYPGEVFEGEIAIIYPQKNERTQTFKVEANFDEPPKKLFPGLAGEANIIIAKKENILTIPLEYLTKNSEVNTPNGLIKVTTGAKNLQQVEITAGLNENSEILKPEE